MVLNILVLSIKIMMIVIPINNTNIIIYNHIYIIKNKKIKYIIKILK